MEQPTGPQPQEAGSTNRPRLLVYSDGQAVLKSPAGDFTFAELTKGADGVWWAVSMASSNAVRLLRDLEESVALLLGDAPGFSVREWRGMRGEAARRPSRAGGAYHSRRRTQ